MTIRLFAIEFVEKLGMRRADHLKNSDQASREEEDEFELLSAAGILWFDM